MSDFDGCDAFVGQGDHPVIAFLLTEVQHFDDRQETVTTAVTVSRRCKGRDLMVYCQNGEGLRNTSFMGDILDFSGRGLTVKSKEQFRQIFDAYAQGCAHRIEAPKNGWVCPHPNFVDFSVGRVPLQEPATDPE